MTARTWRSDGPGSFQAPAGVTHVRDRTGRLWIKSGPRWFCGTVPYIRWCVLIAEHGPVTEETSPR